MTISQETYFSAQPQTKRGAERCLAFLDAATDLFIQKGYDAVSLDDIVQHAGGSKASIYKFFGSKEGLFSAICDYRRDSFLNALYSQIGDQELDIKTLLTKILHNFHAHLTMNDAAFFKLLIERTKNNPELGCYLYEHGPQKVLDHIKNHLMQAHEKKEIACPFPDFSAKMILGYLWHLKWKALMNIQLHENKPETIAYIDYCVHTFMKAHTV